MVGTTFRAWVFQDNQNPHTFEPSLLERSINHNHHPPRPLLVGRPGWSDRRCSHCVYACLVLQAMSSKDTKRDAKSSKRESERPVVAATPGASTVAAATPQPKRKSKPSRPMMDEYEATLMISERVRPLLPLHLFCLAATATAPRNKPLCPAAHRRPLIPVANGCSVNADRTTR
jgi:hypothetical protein